MHLTERIRTWRKSRAESQAAADRAAFWAQVEEQALSMSRHPAGKGRAVPYRTGTPLFEATVKAAGFRPRRPSIARPTAWIVPTSADDDAAVADLLRGCIITGTLVGPREDGAR
jgi:hypothetical protein